jgi:hypothetical protein
MADRRLDTGNWLVAGLTTCKASGDLCLTVKVLLVTLFCICSLICDG